MRIAVVRQGLFELDPRCRREVHALLQEGHEVDVISRRDEGRPWLERDGRLTVRRLPIPLRRGGAFTYLADYALFFIAALVVLTRCTCAAGTSSFRSTLCRTRSCSPRSCRS